MSRQLGFARPKGAILRYETAMFIAVAATIRPSANLRSTLKRYPIVPGRGTLTGRAALEGKTVHVPDVLADPEYTLTGARSVGGYRTMLGVPLLREGSRSASLSLMRMTARPFTDKQIELVTTFADQAVIAIENVRLFDEVQARTRELAQSVEELQALGEVSQAVNSTLDLETVLTTIVGGRRSSRAPMPARSMCSTRQRKNFVCMRPTA